MSDLISSPFGEFLGIQVLSAADGESVCQIDLKPHHLNNGGRVHGGVLTSLADTAAGLAVRTVRPDGSQTATTDLSIAFIRPPAGESLQAQARVIHAGSRLFRTEIAVYSADKLVAKTSATFMLIN
ncbi:MAG: PaaI family thioesterase [Pseudomonadales bacterium]|nr:PaaI family thioesterase [Pseudomonadales bacterium]